MLLCQVALLRQPAGKAALPALVDPGCRVQRSAAEVLVSGCMACLHVGRAFLNDSKAPLSLFGVPRVMRVWCALLHVGSWAVAVIAHTLHCKVAALG
jgi:hypothetical protein